MAEETAKSVSEKPVPEKLEELQKPSEGAMESREKEKAKTEVEEETKTQLSDLGARTEVFKKILSSVQTFNDEGPKKMLDEKLSKSTIPGKGWEKPREEWINACIDALKKEPAIAAETLEKVLGENGTPGAFEKWLKEKAEKDKGEWKNYHALWLERMKTKKFAEDEGKKPFREDIEKIIEIVPTEFEILKLNAMGFRDSIETASLSDLREKDPELNTLKELANKAAELTQILASALPVFEGLKEGKTVLAAKRNEIEALKKQANDANTLTLLREKADKFIAEINDWKNFEALLSSPYINEGKKKELLEAAKTEQKTIKESYDALQASISEAQARESISVAEEAGFADKIQLWLAKAKFISPKIKTTIYSLILGLAAAVSSIPFFGKTLRNMLGSRRSLLMASQGKGNEKLANELTLELNTLARIQTYGIPKNIGEDLLDTDVESFLTTSSSAFSNEAQVQMGISQLQQKVRESGLVKDPKISLCKLIGSNEWREKVPPPQIQPQITAEAKPEKIKEKTPEEKTASLLKEQIGFSPDQTEAVNKLTIKDLLEDKAKYPDGTPVEKIASLKKTISAYVTEEQKKNADLKVADFFAVLYKEGKSIEVKTS